MVETTTFSMFSRRTKQQGTEPATTLAEPPPPPPPPPPARMPAPLPAVSHPAIRAPRASGLFSTRLEPATRPLPEPAQVPAPAPVSQEAVDAISWEGVQVEHELIGLATPEAWTVNASVGEAPSVQVSADATGLYRPAAFRAAPWSGFSYDISADRLSGLVAGTLLLTGRGEVAVEHLIPGDCVMALRGPALLPVLWIGRSTAALPPILIAAGALGADRPNQPLLVGQNQPIFADPVPVVASRLVNGTTVRVSDIHDADLFHIDVGRQEVLFAHNLALASAIRPQ